MLRRTARQLPSLLFVVSVLGMVWAYGVLAATRGLFPYPEVASLIRQAEVGMGAVSTASGVTRPWWYVTSEAPANKAVVHDRGGISPGLTLIFGMDDADELLARVIDADGATVHSWQID